MTRKRTNRSARQAGARFEKQVADYLSWALNDDRVERRVKNGVKDRGDINGIKHMGERVVIECKNTSKLELAKFMAEAETEAGNDDATIHAVTWKRPRIGMDTREGMGEQAVIMPLKTFAYLLNDCQPLGKEQE